MLLFNKTTVASTSRPFRVSNGRTPSLKASGLSGAEVIELKCEINDSFVDATDSAGAAVELTATSPTLTIIADGTYMAVLPANPANPVTLQLG